MIPVSSFVLCCCVLCPGYEGNTDDLASVETALHGVYGAWVNIDGFTVGEQKEMWSGMRIFELAKKAGRDDDRKTGQSL